jgi:tetratricopeptide (TPR) repeat protein
MQGMRMLSDGTTIAKENQSLTIPRGSILVHPDEEVLRRLDSLWKARKDVKYLSDYAMALVVNGNYEEAKNSYLELEKVKPGQYATASNLGTVYELLGDDKNALLWIQKAVQLNPASHDSSEWLHVRILEAKIGGDKFMNTNFLLHTDFGRDSMPTSELSKEELEHLRKALFYQLNERLTFIHSQDKVVAQLLFDLADLSLLTGMNIYQVNDIYSMAKKYGYANPIWGARHMNAKKLSEKINRGQVPVTIHGQDIQTPEIDFPWAIILGICFLIFPVVMFFYLKSKMNGNSKYFIYKKK